MPARAQLVLCVPHCCVAATRQPPLRALGSPVVPLAHQAVLRPDRSNGTRPFALAGVEGGCGVSHLRVAPVTGVERQGGEPPRLGAMWCVVVRVCRVVLWVLRPAFFGACWHGWRRCQPFSSFGLVVSRLLLSRGRQQWLV